MKILLIAGAAVIAALLAVAYACYRMAFYAPKRRSLPPETIELPEGPVYEPFHPQMEQWAREVRSLPRQEFSVTSFDGLTLHGKFFEYAPGAPIELMFHGYRGTAERDLSGGVQRCFLLGRSALIVDQRTSGKSGGHTISFGINERKDCLAWVDFLVEHFGPDVKIILTGISMGAATVLTAAGMTLPKNVIGVLADCGYTSAKDIIETVCRQIHLPPKVIYPFIKLGAKIYGDFDLEELSPVESMKKCKIPVIFYHGEDDAFVPCSMSRENYEVCTAPKRLVTVPGAGHGLACIIDNKGYLQALDEFSREYWE